MKWICLFILILFFPFRVSAAEPSFAAAVQVNHYIMLDGTWTKIAETSFASGPVLFNGSYRYYLTQEQVEEVYGPYGFSVSDLTSGRVLVHTDEGSSTIWADAVYGRDFYGNYRIPVGSTTGPWDMYYLPGNVPESDSYFTSSKHKNEIAANRENTVYSIRFEDPYHFLPDFDGHVSYAAYGKDISVTVPHLSGLFWSASSGFFTQEAGNGFAVVSGRVTDSVTFVLSNEELEGSYVVSYDTDVDLVQIGGFTGGRQTVTQEMTVEGQTLYSDLVSDIPSSGYVLKEPDDDYAIVTVEGGKQFYYSFIGWDYAGELYQPGGVISEQKLIDSGGSIRVEAVYQAIDGNGRAVSVNFFVNLACEIMDTDDNGFNSQPANLFTDSVAASRLFGTDSVPADGWELNVQLTASADAENAYAVDSQIRGMETTPVDGVTIDDFPTDEEVLRRIRETGEQVSIDGEVIPSEDLVPDNFSIRWYVVKYESTDGWHVDGILVAKGAKLLVEKTFLGDPDAVASVKENFDIRMTNTGTGSTYPLVLVPADNAADGEFGYVSHDAATDTYSWEITLRQNQTYEITEENYVMRPELVWNTSAEYMVSNSDGSTGGWRTYTDSITISAETYADDAPVTSWQTVSFRNRYTRAGVLTLEKLDAATHRGMPGVEFLLESDEAFTLRRKPGTWQYSIKENAATEGYTEAVDPVVIETDANGVLYLELTEGAYTLTEAAPVGYFGPERVMLSVDASGIIMFLSSTGSPDAMEPDGGWVWGDGTGTLSIQNTSKLLTTVRVEKDWGDTPWTEPVIVQLWRDGRPVEGAEYTQVLSEENGWAYEWQDLPLFTDMDVAEYTVRETAIGDIVYDAGADADGYEDYTVSVDNTLYSNDGGEYTQDGFWYENGDVVYADLAFIRIHNRITPRIPMFLKVTETGAPLSGALFGLYADEACGTLVSQAESDSHGWTEFPEMNAGTYYIKELSAPEGYEASDVIYRAEVRADGTVLYDGEGNVLKQLENKKEPPVTVYPDELPETGGRGLVFFLLICAGFVLAGVFLAGKRLPVVR